MRKAAATGVWYIVVTDSHGRDGAVSGCAHCSMTVATPAFKPDVQIAIEDPRPPPSYRELRRQSVTVGETTVSMAGDDGCWRAVMCGNRQNRPPKTVNGCRTGLSQVARAG